MNNRAFLDVFNNAEVKDLVDQKLLFFKGKIEKKYLMLKILNNFVFLINPFLEKML